MLSTRVISEAQAQLRTYGQLRASGLNRRGVERALADGFLRRVSRDSYVDAEYWRQTTSEIRHLIQMLAALARAEKPPVFSHHSAAILHRLPLFQFRDEPLHMTALQGPRVNSKGKIVRHIGRLEADDLLCRRTLVTKVPQDTGDTSCLRRSVTFRGACSSAALWVCHC